ncbi:MAG: hypothetical protein SNJ77_03100 [Cytophagales bacterium]
MKTNLLLLFFCLLFFACSNSDASEKISSTKVLDLVKKGKPVFIQNKTIVGVLDFTELKSLLYPSLPRLNSVEIPVAIYFENCTFDDEIVAYKISNGMAINVVFQKTLTFFSCTFKSKVFLKEIEVRGESNFEKNVFQKDFFLEGSRFFGINVVFNETTFKNKTNFSRVIFEGKTSWRNITFEEETTFQNTDFKDSFFMADAIFNKNLDFSLATFRKKMSFNHVTTIDFVDFTGSSFLGQADFLNNEPSKSFSFNESVFYQKARFEPQEKLKLLDISNTLFLLKKIN